LYFALCAILYEKSITLATIKLYLNFLIFIIF
jgi:hypothetical protein